MIYLVLSIFLLETVAATEVIETIPHLPSKEVARGYSGLILTISFIYNGMETGQCSWSASNGRTIFIFTNFVSCKNRTDSDFSVTCVKRDNTVFSTLKLPVVDTLLLSTSKNMVWNVLCDSKNISTVTVTVRECTVDQPLTVIGVSDHYNSNGTFNCNNNGELFYRNGTRLNIPRTTCLNTAKWSGSQELECWKAPNVTVTAINLSVNNATVIEGGFIKFSCNYDDTVPVGNNSIFYFNDEKSILSRGEHYTTEDLSRYDDQKKIFCQAQTPYTMENVDTGRSMSISINVLYPPYWDSKQSCTWMFGQSETCIVRFFSNPSPTYISLKKDGQEVQNFFNYSLSNSFPYKFEFRTYKVEEKDSGIYQLKISSSMFNGSINFNILVTNSSSIVIGAVAGGVLGAVVLVLIVVMVIRITQKNNSMICKTFETKDYFSSEKQIVTNELYGQTGTAAKQVITNELYVPLETKGSAEKVMKENDLYMPLENNADYDQTQGRSTNKTPNSKNYSVMVENQDRTIAPVIYTDANEMRKTKNNLQDDQDTRNSLENKSGGRNEIESYTLVDLAKKKKKKQKEDDFNIET